MFKNKRFSRKISSSEKAHHLIKTFKVENVNIKNTSVFNFVLQNQIKSNALFVSISFIVINDIAKVFEEQMRYLLSAITI